MRCWWVRVRGAGTERKDLLDANGAIFPPQDKVLNEHAKCSVRVLEVGNPANPSALIAMRNARDLDPSCFTAMMRLDHTVRCRSWLKKAGHHSADVKGAITRGNHSSTQ